MLTRRSVLTTLSALGLAPLLFAADLKSPVVDTHLHCFAGKNDPLFPYHEDRPYQPAEPSTPEHLLGLMVAAGVDYAIVVHPEPYQDDHRYLEHCLTAGRGKLKGTCLFFAVGRIRRTGCGHSSGGVRSRRPGSTPTTRSACRRSGHRHCATCGNSPEILDSRCSYTLSLGMPRASSRISGSFPRSASSSTTSAGPSRELRRNMPSWSAGRSSTMW